MILVPCGRETLVHDQFIVDHQIGKKRQQAVNLYDRERNIRECMGLLVFRDFDLSSGRGRQPGNEQFVYVLESPIIGYQI